MNPDDLIKAPSFVKRLDKKCLVCLNELTEVNGREYCGHCDLKKFHDIADDRRERICNREVSSGE